MVKVILLFMNRMVVKQRVRCVISGTELECPVLHSFVFTPCVRGGVTFYVYTFNKMCEMH